VDVTTIPTSDVVIEYEVRDVSKSDGKYAKYVLFKIQVTDTLEEYHDKKDTAYDLYFGPAENICDYS